MYLIFSSVIFILMVLFTPLYGAISKTIGGAVYDPPDAGCLVEDTFTGTGNLNVHTADTGQTWTLLSGVAVNLNLTGSQLTSSNQGTSSEYLSYVPSDAEYTVRAEITADSLDSNRTPGLAGRMDTTDVTFYTVNWNASTDLWTLSRYDAGAQTVLGTYAGDSPETATRTVRLEITDASKVVDIGGTDVITSADNTITAVGRPGVTVFNSSTGNISFLDNLCVLE